MTYKEYLNTDHWQNLRRNKFKFGGRKCVICQETKTVDVHHIRYRENLFETEPKDLIVLCRACHRMVHRHGTNTLSKKELLEIYGDFAFIEPEPGIKKRLDDRFCKKKLPRGLRSMNAGAMAEKWRGVRNKP